MAWVTLSGNADKKNTTTLTNESLWPKVIILSQLERYRAVLVELAVRVCLERSEAHPCLSQSGSIAIVDSQRAEKFSSDQRVLHRSPSPLSEQSSSNPGSDFGSRDGGCLASEPEGIDNLIPSPISWLQNGGEWACQVDPVALIPLGNSLQKG